MMYRSLLLCISTSTQPEDLPMSSLHTVAAILTHITGKTWAKAEVTPSNLQVLLHLAQPKCRRITKGGRWYLRAISVHLIRKTEELSSKHLWHKTRNWRSSRMSLVHHPRWSSSTGSTVSRRDQVLTNINNSPAYSHRISLWSNSHNRYSKLLTKIAQASQFTRSSTRKLLRVEEVISSIIMNLTRYRICSRQSRVQWRWVEYKTRCSKTCPHRSRQPTELESKTSFRT